MAWALRFTHNKHYGLSGIVAAGGQHPFGARSWPWAPLIS